MAKKMTGFIFTVIFSAIFLAHGCFSAVPAVIWNENSSLDLTSTANSVDMETFQGDYLEKLSENPEQNLLIFLQDQLSLDDITQHADVYNQQSSGGIFDNLKTLMDAGNGFHLPSVSSPVDAVQKWKELLTRSVIELSEEPYTLTGKPLSENGGNIVIVQLPGTGIGENRAESLKRIDDIMGSLSGEMRILGKPYAALYTGRDPQKSPTERLYLGRHLLASGGATGYHLYNVSGCVLFYASSMQFSIKSHSQPPWTLPTNLKTDGSTCGNGSAVFKLQLPAAQPDGLTEFSITFNFATEKGWWVTTNDTQVSYNLGQQTKDAFLDATFISAPLLSSYHCTDAPALKEEGASNSSEGNDQATLIIKDLQLQAIEIKNQFGAPNDCVGFFTIGIWSGLVTTLLLVIVLSFGLVMLANINTMDRFDDPKGKTITVNVSE